MLILLEFFLVVVELKLAPFIFNQSKNDNWAVFFFAVFFMFAFSLLVGKGDLLLRDGSKNVEYSSWNDTVAEASPSWMNQGEHISSWKGDFEAISAADGSRVLKFVWKEFTCLIKKKSAKLKYQLIFYLTINQYS